jgi:adenylylsulfate kinase-like enzyme
MQQRGIIPITATICGFRLFREIVRENLKNPRFIYLDCPFNVAAQRDQKGHYSKALAGQIKNFFDVDIPFETPANCEIKIDSDQLKPQEIIRRIGDHFNRVGILRRLIVL